jgi:uncharacterized protein YfaS (alpha-2-macroglobulin family)
MTPRRILTTAAAAVLLLSLACSLPGLSLPFGRSTPTPTRLPPLAPTLAESDPAPGEELDPSGPLTLYFDQPMDRASVDAALTFDPAVEAIPTWVDDQTLELRPVSALPRDAAYRLTIAASARSAAGLALIDPVVLALRIAAPLRVVQVMPDPDTAEVDPGSPITVVFNRPVVPLQAEGALPVPLTLDPAMQGTGEWVDTGIYLFRPLPSLPGGQRINARVEAGLQDLTGAPLEEAYEWSFVTALPKVVSAEPASDGRPQPLDVPIQIAFNQAMDRASVERAFMLAGPGGASRSGAFTWNDDATKFTFKPSARLEYDADYEARLAAGAAAPSGSSLGSSLSLPFHTVGRPAILSSTPTDGGQKDEWEGVQLTFAGPMDLPSLRRALTLTPAIENMGTWWSEDSYTFSVYGDYDPSRSYTLTLAASAADAYGSTLGAPFRLSFSTRDLSPLSGFMRYSDVLSLDATGEPLLQVQARNATALDFTLYRLSLPQFFRLMRDGVYTAENAPQGDLLRQWSMAVPAKRNVMQTLDVSLQDEPLPTGVYLLQMTGPDYGGFRTQARVIVVRDTELVLKAAQDSALTWAVDLRSGRPAPGLPVQIVNGSGNTLATGSTSSDGTVSLNFTPAQDVYAPVLALVGKPGERPFGVASTGWADEITPWSFGVNFDPAAPTSRVYLYTDRPIYRPGQTVRFRGILRNVDDAQYSLPSEKTLEVTLLDGFGEQAGKLEAPVGAYGAFSGEFKLPSTSALGFYSINTSTGGVSFTVAAYRKPEFEVTVEPSLTDVGFGDSLQAVIQGEYYFGGPVAGAQVQWSAWASAYFPPDLPQPIDWFAYADGPQYDYSQMLAEGQGETDSEGRLSIDLPTTPEVSRPLQITIAAVLTDSAGMPVQGESIVRLHPASVYLGLDPESYAVASGSQSRVAVTAVDWEGAPVAGQPIHTTLDRITWTQSVDADGRFNWEEQAERVNEADLTASADGTATVTFRPERPGSYRLRVEGRDSSGRTAVSSLTLWAYGAEQFTWRSPGTNRIALVADRGEYKPGDTARILIPSPFDQPVQALVTIERGRVLSSKVVEIAAGQTTVDLPLDETHVPNVFVSAVLVRPSGASAPAAMAAGLIELRVSAESRSLTVSVSPDRPQAGPGEQVTYALRATDAQGKPVQAEFSLALADVAALALAEPNSPDPITAFYSPVPLSVRTGSALAVSGEGGRGVSSADGMGGGGGEGSLEPTVRTEFPDTAYWNASILTDAKGEADITLTLPDSLTTWRMDARGITADTRAGSATSDLITSKSLLIRPVTPRFFTAGDAATVAAIVHNNTAESIEVEARLEAEGATLESNARQKIEVPSRGQVRVEWSLQILDAASVGLTFYAKGGGLEDASTPTIGSAVDGRIPILRYSASDTFATSGGLTGQGGRLEAVSLPRRYDATQGGLTVTLEPSLGAAMQSALEVLEAFPYECTEQVASRFLPNLAAYRAAQALGTEIPGLQDRLQRTVTAGLQTLRARQQYDGGWGWWTSGPTDPYLTSYVLYALQEARRSGWTVNDYVIESAVGYLQAQIGAIDSLSEAPVRNRQAFMLYVLARANAPDAERLQALVAARAGMSFWARASLALAIDSSSPGDPAVATLLSDLKGGAVRSATGVHWEDETPDLWNMGASVRTTAQVLQAMLELQPDDPLNPDAVRWLLAARQRDGAWASTHDTAWALLALTEWAGVSGSLDGAFDFGATLNAQALLAGAAPTDTQSAFTPIDQLFGDRPNQLLVTRGPGAGALFYTVHLSVYRPVEDIAATSRGLTVSREYFHYDGACGSLEKPCAPAPSARAGDALLARVTVSVPSDQFYVVVEDPFPAGMEPIDGSLLTAPSGMPPEMLAQAQTDRVGWKWWYFTRAEMRDDRLVLFADHLPAGTYQYTYLLTAALPGEYRVLPTRAWDFYFPETYGHSAGRVYSIQP